MKKCSSELEQLIIGVGSEYSVLDYLSQGDNVLTLVPVTDAILSAWDSSQWTCLKEQYGIEVVGSDSNQSFNKRRPKLKI